MILTDLTGYEAAIRLDAENYWCSTDGADKASYLAGARRVLDYWRAALAEPETQAVETARVRYANAVIDLSEFSSVGPVEFYALAAEKAFDEMAEAIRADERTRWAERERLLVEAAMCPHGAGRPWIAFDDHAECRHCHWCNRSDVICFFTRHVALAALGEGRTDA